MASPIPEEPPVTRAVQSWKLSSANEVLLLSLDAAAAWVASWLLDIVVVYQVVLFTLHEFGSARMRRMWFCASDEWM